MERPLEKLSNQNQVKRRIAVIGIMHVGSLAYQLSKEDCDIDIFEHCSEISDGASGNPLAALYPKFNLTTELITLIFLAFVMQVDFISFDQFKDAYFPSELALLILIQT